LRQNPRTIQTPVGRCEAVGACLPPGFGVRLFKESLRCRLRALDRAVSGDLRPSRIATRTDIQFRITSRRFTNLRKVTARSPQEVPGLSQATAFTASRASTRSVRGVTPSLLCAVPLPRCRLGKPSEARLAVTFSSAGTAAHWGGGGWPDWRVTLVHRAWCTGSARGSRCPDGGTASSQLPTSSAASTPATRDELSG